MNSHTCSPPTRPLTTMKRNNPGADRREHVQAKALAGGHHDGSLTFGRPSGARVPVRADSRFIAEVDFRPDFAGRRVNPGIFLFQPLLDQARVLFIGHIQRTLTGQTQLREQPPDRNRAQLNPEPIPDQFHNNRARPQGKRKLKLQRALHGHGMIDPAKLLPVEPTRPTGNRLGPQGLPSAFSIPSQPLIDTRPGKPQRLDHDFRTRTSLHLFHRAHSNRFQGLMIQFPRIASCHCHVPIIDQDLEQCQHTYAFFNKNDFVTRSS